MDTSTNAVLISQSFVYFGGTGPEIPRALREDFDTDLVHSTQGHRCRLPDELIIAAVRWINELGAGVQGRPADW